jgi:hypothetical protein
MIAKRVRIGSIADQDKCRREDMLAMTPQERIMTLFKLRDHQCGAASKPIRGSGVVSYRRLEHHSSSEPLLR